jgi:hypothetical protein
MEEKEFERIADRLQKAQSIYQKMALCRARQKGVTDLLNLLDDMYPGETLISMDSPQKEQPSVANVFLTYRDTKKEENRMIPLAGISVTYLEKILRDILGTLNVTAEDIELEFKRI